MAKVVVTTDEDGVGFVPFQGDVPDTDGYAGVEEAHHGDLPKPHIVNVNVDDPLTPTSNALHPRTVPLLTYPFEFYNPVQSAAYPYAAADCNVVVSANTSTGKTVVGEMFLAESIWNGKKGLFCPPLKAVANEKYSDWTRKPYGFGLYSMQGQLNVSICTGDFQLTPDRSRELAESHLIVMTPEMLDSRSRRQHSEGNSWLNQIGTIVLDETHLMGMEDRGHGLESAVMRFTRGNQDCRIVALSATLPNVEELAEWFTKLNGKPTIVIKSDWRPCALDIHYEVVYLKSRTYNERQAKLADTAAALATRYSSDKILIFVQTKKHGVQVRKKLAEAGIAADFHSSDLNAVEREYIENRFKNDQSVRVIVSTPTLAWGINMPARRVIVCGSKRGYSGTVHAYDLAQMCGRAGRTGYDVKGDAHILLPDDDFTTEKHRLEHLPDIVSQIRDYTTDAAHDGRLSFHLISEFHNKKPYESNYDTAIKWFGRSFAAHQKKELTRQEAIDICDTLWKLNAVDKRELRGDALFAVTGLGKVASYMYMSPHDVHSYYQNFSKLFKLDSKYHEDAAALAWCMSNVDSYLRHEPYFPESDDYVEKHKQYDQRLNDIGITTGPRSKLGVYFFLAASGRNAEIPQIVQFNLAVMRQDLQRVVIAISLIDRLFAHWKKPKTYWAKLETRIVSGVNSLQAELCLIPNVGPVKSEQLIQHGIMSVEDFVSQSNISIIHAIMKSRANTAIKAAEKLVLELAS